MGHVGNPRSFRLTHQRVGKPLSGNLISLLEHRLRYWGSKAELINAQPEPSASVVKTSRLSKFRGPAKGFSASFLNYLVNIRGRLLYDHPSWRQLWYPANYKGAYAHYYHMWKQSGDVVSRKSSLIRPTQRRMRISPFGYYSHSYFLGKADGSFISKPMFMSRFLASRGLSGYQFPNPPALNKPVEGGVVEPKTEGPLRSFPAQPAPGFTFDPYVYRNKRIMPRITTKFLYFFKGVMLGHALKEKFKKITPSLLRKFRLQFLDIYPDFRGAFIDGGRGVHNAFEVKLGRFPVDKLKPVSRNHGLFDFFNFLEFKTDSASALPNVAPISDLCTESLLKYSRRRPKLIAHDKKLRLYVKNLKKFYEADIKKRELESETFGSDREPNEEQLAEYISLRKRSFKFFKRIRKLLPRTFGSIFKLRFLRRRARFARKFGTLLRGLHLPKRVAVKKGKVRAKLPSQTLVTSGSKRVKKV